MCIYVIRLLGKPINIIIIQIYVPSTETEGEKNENFCTSMQEEADMLINIETKVGNKAESTVIKKLELRVRNKVGD